MHPQAEILDSAIVVPDGATTTSTTSTTTTTTTTTATTSTAETTTTTFGSSNSVEQVSSILYPSCSTRIGKLGRVGIRVASG